MHFGSIIGWVSVLLLALQIAAGQELNRVAPAQARLDQETQTDWYNVKLLPIEGKAWKDTKSDYDRLPARAEGTVRDAVWNLSRDSSGMAVRFVTDATTIFAAWSLTKANLAMPHMPATGVSGLDLYVRDEKGQWRWLACGRPTGIDNNVTLTSGIPNGQREYMLYLPLYNGVTQVELGIPEGAQLYQPPERPADHQRPLVFYGTSITHGACASRPGMTHPAILGRRFARPIVNLGFSGNGRMETEVVEIMAEIDAEVFILDCLPNIDAAAVRARTEPCIKILREAHPHTPILLVEDRSYADAFLITNKRERNESSRAALREIYQRLKAAGDDNLYYLPGDHLLGDDNEGTVDSSHPTDLGFMRQADAFAEALTPILGEE